MHFIAEKVDLIVSNITKIFVVGIYRHNHFPYTAGRLYHAFLQMSHILCKIIYTVRLLSGFLLNLTGHIGNLHRNTLKLLCTLLNITNQSIQIACNLLNCLL